MINNVSAVFNNPSYSGPFNGGRFFKPKDDIEPDPFGARDAAQTLFPIS